MRLLMFEHCSLCFKVRMIAALKGIALEEQIVEDDDSAAMVDLIGRRQIPILVLDDGTPMLESDRMVEHIEAMGNPLLTGPERPEIADLARRMVAVTPHLTMGRYPLLPLKEFRTAAARDHYNARKHPTYGDFAALRARTPELLDQLRPILAELDTLIESPEGINGTPSRDDIRILPLLRSVAVVEGLTFPENVAAYFDTMMTRTGQQPLPQI